MADYIERRPLFDALYDAEAITVKGINIFRNFPVADVRPMVRGKWIDHQEDRWIYAKCSECGTVHDVKSNFCPNCGADMREES
jgi:rubrerythrin